MEPVSGLRGASPWGPSRGEDGAEPPSVVVEVRERVEAAEEATPGLPLDAGGVPPGRRGDAEKVERREGKIDHEAWFLRAVTAGGGTEGMSTESEEAAEAASAEAVGEVEGCSMASAAGSPRRFVFFATIDAASTTFLLASASSGNSPQRVASQDLATGAGVGVTERSSSTVISVSADTSAEPASV